MAIRHNEITQRIAEMTTNMGFYDRKFRNLQEITNNNATNIGTVQHELVSSNEKISSTKNELMISLNDQYRSTLEITHKIDSKINDLKELSEQSIKLSTEN